MMAAVVHCVGLRLLLATVSTMSPFRLVLVGGCLRTLPDQGHDDWACITVMDTFPGNLAKKLPNQTAVGGRPSLWQPKDVSDMLDAWHAGFELCLTLFLSWYV